MLLTEILKKNDTQNIKNYKKSMAPAVVNITWLDITYLLTMIMGILAKEIWDNINETGVISIKIPRLIAALIVSPIIYAAIHSKLIPNQLSLLGLAVAFQNGFFWQSVFRTIQGGSP
jgi:hypothetical protein